MPISREAIERAATAFKIMHLRKQGGMDAVAVRLNRRPNPKEMLYTATWAAAFQLSEENHDPEIVADMLEKIMHTGKVPGQ